MIAVGLLRWIYASPSLRPDPMGFLESPHARGEHWSATATDLGPVVAWLTSLELVTTRSASWDSGVPSRVGLTGSGLMCAGHFDGDVLAWQASDPSPNHVRSEPSRARADVPEPRGRTRGAEGEGSDAQQVSPGPIAGLARVARVVLLSLPVVCLDEDEGARITQAARTVIAEAGADKVSPRALQRAGKQLRDELARSSASQTLGVVLVDGLDDELRACAWMFGGEAPRMAAERAPSRR